MKVTSIYAHKNKNPNFKLLNDKDIYFKLSKSEKYDYTFLKKIFNNYSCDIEFLDKVINDINSDVNEDWKLEFLIRYVNILEKNKDCNLDDYMTTKIPYLLKEKILNYKFLINLETNAFLTDVDEIKKDLENGSAGIGFIIIYQMFDYSEILLNHYAFEYIKRIFKKVNLETYLHKTFSSFDELEDIGINKFIIDIILKYDKFLADYVINHQDLLDEIRYALNYIKKYWNIYVREEKSEVLNLVKNKLYSYIYENEFKDYNAHQNINRIWYASFYSAYNLGILKEFFHSTMSDENYHYYNLVKNYCRGIDIENADILFKIDYENIKKIMIECLLKTSDLTTKNKISLKLRRNY